MNTRRIVTVFALIALMMSASGCRFLNRKPKVPQQAQAPTISQPTNNVPTTQPGPPPPVGVEPARPLPTPGEVVVATATPPKKLPAPKRRVVPPPPVPPKKTVVQNEAPPAQIQGGQLTASISQGDPLHQKLDTAQLIEATEGNLRTINRTLSNDEQAMVQHVRAYINQSQKASADGDLERAYNLALKAHLLSDELAKKK